MGAAPAGSSRPLPSISPIGPEPCRDLPVSSSLVSPVSCFVTGATSVLVTGSRPSSAGDGAAVVVEGQRLRRTAVSGSGPLHVAGITNGHACLKTNSGSALDLDLSTIRLAASSTCPAAAGPPSRSGPAPTASEEVMAQAQAAGGPPAPASSYYVYGADVAACAPTATTGCRLYVDGADEPAPSGGALMILDFGAPCFDPATGIYGSQLFNTRSCTTDDQLLPLAQAFYRGYQSTHGSATPLAIMGLGTSNNTNGVNPTSLTGPQLTDSGKAWFQNLVQPFAATTSGAAPVVTWGANDIEDSTDTASWFGPDLTITWVNGYGAAASTFLGSVKQCSSNDPYRLANYGDNVLNAGGWSDQNIYEVSWGLRVACAVPEIYVTANGAEWQRTSQWGVSNGRGPIPFTGPMSLGGEANSLSAAASWNTLAAATGQATPYLTDIGSLNSSTPSAPTNVLALAGDQAASVWWSASASDGGSPVQDYSVTAYQGNTPGPSTTVRGLPPPTGATVRGLTNGLTYTFVVTATNAAGTGSGSTPSNAVVPGPGRYHPLTPTRILDTRDGTGGTSVPLGPGGQLTLQVSGNASPVPATGVGAVVLNVTVTRTTAPSYLTVWPAQLPRPTASNLNWTTGITVPNLVEVPVGPGGGVSFFNAAGNTDVIADVEGYVGLANEPPAPDGLYSPQSPNRVLDTRNNIGHNGAVGPGVTNVISVPVAQAGQEAVVLNMTVTNPTAAGYLTVWPHGAPQPTVSNLNFSAGQTTANRVMVKAGTGGMIDIFNPVGRVDVIADLNGAFTDTTVGGSGAQFQGMPPVRILDTRDGTGGIGGALGPRSSRALPVAGANGIPIGATAVVANLTVTNTSAPGYLTAWPDLEQQPIASDLNWVAHQTVPNLVVVKLADNGKLDLYNAAGSTDVILDVVGYYR